MSLDNVLKVGFIGWRGMVGSVLMERMQAENDFALIAPTFFSTSQVGAMGPSMNGVKPVPLLDANATSDLSKMDVLISCQGGDYTTAIHPKLRASGWQGYWIDAASSLRMAAESTIILDPVNQSVIEEAIKNGQKDFIGGNCTVSLMLMAVIGLIRTGQVEWISTMTYQAASGAGAKHMRELLLQMGALRDSVADALADKDSPILDLDKKVREVLVNRQLPLENFGYPLAANLLPWIDKELPNGQSREEWKAEAEANKILGYAQSAINKNLATLPIDGLCVRVGALRAHSQALTIKMKKPMSPEEAARHIKGAHPWLTFVENHKEESMRDLTPAAVSGQLNVAIGRLRGMSIGPEYLTCFTVGDQLLWGAAEPLRRMLRILLKK